MNDFLLYLVLIPSLAVSAQWIAWRTNLPSILLLLLFGIALGTYVHPDELLANLTEGNASATGPRLLFPLVSLAVAVIMFEGGLSLKLSDLKESGESALRLCTLGAALTWIGVTFAAMYCLQFDWRLSCLLGAILTVTGPTVIGPILNQVRPTKRVANTLKWEGIVIDPIGAVLAVLVFDTVLLDGGQATASDAGILLAKICGVGIIAGVTGGILLTYALRTYLLPDNLHGVASLAMALLLFGVSNHLAHESGLIAVTALGIWLTNQKNFDIEHIIELQENLRTLFIGCLFIVLGSRIELQQLQAVGWSGATFVIVLILVIRPLSVVISCIGSRLSWNEKAFVAGLAPRGIVAAAVSSVFALQISESANTALAENAEQLSTVTFMVIIGTVAVYGLSASPFARWLGLSTKTNAGVLFIGADDWVCEFASELNKLGCATLLVDTNYSKVTKARMLGLEAVCANIANEHAREELSLSGIGKMLAVTSNDEINTLAVRECRSLFGRANLYQLTFDTKHRRTVDKSLTGRDLFQAGQDHAVITSLRASGYQWKSTTLSDEFLYDDFIQKYKGALLLAVVTEDEQLSLQTVDHPIMPKAGQKVIALVPKTVEEDETQAASAN